MRKDPSTTEPVPRSDAEWRQRLTPQQYRILRQQDTERAFTGKFWNHKGLGTYRCAGCAQALFRSNEKFESGCGWPTFFLPADKDAVRYVEDRSLGMLRTEVLCNRCGGHLGHLFKDGPPPTHLRYCINSGAMVFEEAK